MKRVMIVLFVMGLSGMLFVFAFLAGLSLVDVLFVILVVSSALAIMACTLWFIVCWAENKPQHTGWISTADRLPEPGVYVLARHNRGTWIDSTDQANVNCVVVKLVMGKVIPPNPPFGTVICEADQWQNNFKPYCWDAFGPDSFFGQAITWWRPIEPLVEGK